ARIISRAASVNVNIASSSRIRRAPHRNGRRLLHTPVTHPRSKAWERPVADASPAGPSGASNTPGASSPGTRPDVAGGHARRPALPPGEWRAARTADSAPPRPTAATPTHPVERAAASPPAASSQGGDPTPRGGPEAAPGIRSRTPHTSARPVGTAAFAESAAVPVRVHATRRRRGPGAGAVRPSRSPPLARGAPGDRFAHLHLDPGREPRIQPDLATL